MTRRGFTPLEISQTKGVGRQKCVKFLTGFTLVEMLVGAAVFAIIAVSIYGASANISRAARLARLKVTAAALANEQFEIMRGLTYDDVGVVGSVPPGRIPHEQTLTRSGATFQVTTVIRNIDDPFDGQIGGTPNDLSPADYKLAALEISCASCTDFPPLNFTTFVAPQSLETSSGNGALFVRVFDAAGEPVSGADVRVVNNQTTPATIIEDSTNNSGVLEIVDAPPGAGAYNITVSKPEYSSEQTYPMGGAGNPNPLKPDVTVAVQQLTQASFAIDRLSSLHLSAVDSTCLPVVGAGFSLTGAKLIGTVPDVYKYDETFDTDSSGQIAINNLEWDDYTLQLTGTTYSLVDLSSSSTLSVLPNTVQDISAIVIPPNPQVLIVAVTDAVTGLPVASATSTLNYSGSEVETLLTNSADSCLPGAALYQGLSTGTYEVTVAHEGYQTSAGNVVEVSADNQKVIILLRPS